jgi:hypothetical protein
MEAWFYLVGYGGEVIMNKWASGAEDKFIGFADATQEPPSCWFWYPGEPAQGSDGAGASSTPTLQAWHHIAAVLGSGTLTLYVDGLATGSGAYGASIGNASGAFNIGATFRGSWHPPINGYIAQVRLSSTAKYTSNFTPSPALTVQSDTIALWPLNEGSGTVAYDNGTHAMNGTIMGTTQWVAAPAIP